jgi:ABC-type branched-subunit amino acid transport system ATPase component
VDAPLGLAPLMVREIARAMLIIAQDDQLSIMLVQPTSPMAAAR